MPRCAANRRRPRSRPGCSSAWDQSDLLARDRRPTVARARKVAIYLARELTGKSLPEIGRSFGGRDHSTILAAVRSLAGDIEQDEELANVVDSLKRELGGSS